MWSALWDPWRQTSSILLINFAIKKLQRKEATKSKQVANIVLEFKRRVNCGSTKMAANIRVF